MHTRPITYLFAAALAATSLPLLGQDAPKPTPPTPPAPPENAQRPAEPNRPPGPPQGRGGPGEERRDGHRDGGRGREDGRRPDDGQRRDGDRGPGAGPGPGPGREHSFHVPMPPPAPPVPMAYVGVITQPPPPVLGAQLGLKEGFGLVVVDVLPDSPAAKAGLKRHDVVTKFNDQQLVDAGQFATLVRAAGKDTDATLTLVRTAKEQTVQVKIGERMAPQRMPFPGGMDFHHPMDRWKGPGQDGMKRMQDRMKEYGEKMREYQERMRGWQKNPTADMPALPPPPALADLDNGGFPINPADILLQAQPGGTREIRVLQPNGAISYNTADVKLFLKDDNGGIELTTKDGKRVLVARDAKGETVFNGPIDTEEQREALPEDVRRKLETIHVRTVARAEAETDPQAQSTPVEGDVQ